jgi:membrane-associated phospholipid phosphatase
VIARRLVRGGDPVAARAARLLAGLAALVLVAVGLRALSTLVAGEDLDLVRDAVAARTSTLTTLAHGASVLGRSAVLLAAAAVIALAAAAVRRPRGWIVLLTVGGAIILQNVAKALVDRPRPPVTRLEHVSSTSFPSGHATESAAFFVLLALAGTRSSLSRPLKAAAVLAAAVIIIAVAASRVYLGAHYPTDTIAGILLGGTWAVVTAAAFRSAAPERRRAFSPPFQVGRVEPDQCPAGPPRGR